MSSNFITNKDKFLSDIINGILPKTDAVDFLVGYFYYSGYVQLSENLKSKHIRILVGLDIEIQISKHVCEVENFRQKLLSRGVLKEQYYSEFVKAFNDTDFLDTAEKIEQFKMFYAKILVVKNSNIFFQNVVMNSFLKQNQNMVMMYIYVGNVYQQTIMV